MSRPASEAAPGAAPSPSAARFLASWRGWAILALVGGLLIAWRIHDPRTLWIDEGTSIQLSQYDWATIVRAHERESHPPGHALLLKAWRALGDMVGAPRHIAYERASGLLLWLGWTAWLWFGLRRLLGAGVGAAAAWCVALNPLVVDAVGTIRMYGMGITLSTGAALALALALQRARQDGSRALWFLAAYLALAVPAFYTHFFTMAVLGLVGLAWLVGAWVLLGWRARHVRWGVGAQLLAVACFLPWLPMMRAQFGWYSGLDATWRTPATGLNLARQFLEWYTHGKGPWGVVAVDEGDPITPFLFLNAALLAVIVAAAIRARKWPRGVVAWAAIGCGLVAVAFIAFTWGVTRAGVVHVFHATRYNAFGAPFWALAVVCAAVVAGRAAGWRWLGPAAAGLLLAQGLATSLSGREERLDRGLAGRVVKPASEAFTPGQILYVGEECLFPYVAPTLAADYDVRSMWEIRDHPADAPDADVLLVFTWPPFASQQTNMLVINLRDTDMAGGNEYDRFANRNAVTMILRLRDVEAGNLHLAVEHARSQPHEPGDMRWP